MNYYRKYIAERRSYHKLLYQVDLIYYQYPIIIIVVRF